MTMSARFTTVLLFLVCVTLATIALGTDSSFYVGPCESTALGVAAMGPGLLPGRVGTNTAGM